MFNINPALCFAVFCAVSLAGWREERVLAAFLALHWGELGGQLLLPGDALKTWYGAFRAQQAGHQ